MDVKIEESWKRVLRAEFEEEYFVKLAEFVKSEYKNTTVYPPPRCVFQAFDRTPFDKVRVVILGQDPYHGEGQANGLAFAVGKRVETPPSLVNIYKELKSDLGVEGDINRWSEQGVLLLNATLTVRAHQAGSHQNKGWERFTDAVVKVLNDQRQNLVFILWGNYAQKKGTVIDSNKHMVIRSTHPSPLSAFGGFFGSKPFSQTNAYLILNNLDPIKW